MRNDVARRLPALLCWEHRISGNIMQWEWSRDLVVDKAMNILFKEDKKKFQLLWIMNVGEKMKWLMQILDGEENVVMW